MEEEEKRGKDKRVINEKAHFILSPPLFYLDDKAKTTTGIVLDQTPK